MSAEVTRDKHAIVHADGEIDLANIDQFIEALDEAAEKSPTGFIIDLSDVTYIDSAGVQAIFGVYSKMRAADGCLAVVIGNARIKSVLEVVHLELLPNMSVCDDLDAARQAVSS